MKQLLTVCFLLLFSFSSFAETIPVKNIAELNDAVKRAKPGDIIILQNGEWKDVIIKINCSGTKEKSISFKAQTAGGVKISGKSRLALGGNFIVVDGLYFTEGFAGDDAVISMKTDKNSIANDCRITNCVIRDFNNPRMQENYWVALSGKRNRVDHCSFIDKNNLGVLMAVLLDDDRSRENFHSVDHNYFGRRLPLGSNGGEIIRIGVSQHCEFNSNTQVVDNFFEHCDGETEVVSVKSCSNVVRGNLFKECQGSVVLRHGNYNTVENNIFLGNDKEGTGGVRIINKGQWVVNNYFYHCRGKGFRSPLSIMNGVFNSPANRYVAVTDAVVANNSFIECSPISLCEGSDTERTVTPSHVIFQNNAFYNTKEKKIYDVSDDISRISFINNAVSLTVPQELVPGFIKIKSAGNDPKPGNTPFKISFAVNDSLKAMSSPRLMNGFSEKAGYSAKAFKAVMKNAGKNCGADWWGNTDLKKDYVFDKKEAKDGAELSALLSEAGKYDRVDIELTGTHYVFDKPVAISQNVMLSSSMKLVRFSSSKIPCLFEIKGGVSLSLNRFNVDLEGLQAAVFISSDLNESSSHSLLAMESDGFTNYKGTFFNAVKSTKLDAVTAVKCTFSSMEGTLFNFSNETDSKGYYNAEQVQLNNNKFSNISGSIITMLRGGNDESTMGPLFVFSKNDVQVVSASSPIILLNGTQHSLITANTFNNAAKNAVLIQYTDAVRAEHQLTDNQIMNSGRIVKNKFVTEENNTVAGKAASSSN